MSFACAEEAFDWATRNPVALMVTDYKMPKMNGIEFIRKFRGHPSGAHVPVIVVSGDGDQHTRDAVLEAGATEFMAKPVDHKLCREMCRSIFDEVE